MSIFSALSISASGLQAERTRLDVIASNIANVETTRTPEGGPYRRRVVVLQTATQPQGTGIQVRVAGIEPAPEPPTRLYIPGHPDADADGYVLMPNVQLPTEMADMVLAARAYEANAAAFRAGRELIRQALSILA